MTDRQLIKQYLLNASELLQNAADSDNGELMWAVLTNLHSTIQGYQDAAEMLMFKEQSETIKKRLRK
jgi:hypothetical protein